MSDNFCISCSFPCLWIAVSAAAKRLAESQVQTPPYQGSYSTPLILPGGEAHLQIVFHGVAHQYATCQHLSCSCLHLLEGLSAQHILGRHPADTRAVVDNALLQALTLQLAASSHKFKSRMSRHTTTQNQCALIRAHLPGVGHAVCEGSSGPVLDTPAAEQARPSAQCPDC